MPSTENLARTPLDDVHRRASARMVPFAGWEMPVQYTGIVEEHERVRRAVGLFDVSHMGEMDLRGPGALAAAQRLVTNDVGRLADGRALYTVMCNDAGGIVDDLLVYRVAAEHVFLCINAATTSKDVAWIRARVAQWRKAGDIGAVEVVDRSADYALVAVQGPRAAVLVERLAPSAISLPRFGFMDSSIAGVAARIARTGYTGEDGFELFVAPAAAVTLWHALLEAGADLGAGPVGLGARDTLRLEARLLLYGQDMDEETTPFEAGLGWVVKLGKGGDFAGRAALERAKTAGPRRRLVGFTLAGKGIARHGHALLAGDAVAGVVTSGTFAPSLKRAIGLGYVDAGAVGPLGVRIREREVPIETVQGPFYQTPHGELHGTPGKEPHR